MKNNEKSKKNIKPQTNLFVKKGTRNYKIIVGLCIVALLPLIFILIMALNLGLTYITLKNTHSNYTSNNLRIISMPSYTATVPSQLQDITSSNADTRPYKEKKVFVEKNPNLFSLIDMKPGSSFHEAFVSYRTEIVTGIMPTNSTEAEFRDYINSNETTISIQKDVQKTILKECKNPKNVYSDVKKNINEPYIKHIVSADCHDIADYHIYFSETLYSPKQINILYLTTSQKNWSNNKDFYEKYVLNSMRQLN